MWNIIYSLLEPLLNEQGILSLGFSKADSSSQQQSALQGTEYFLPAARTVGEGIQHTAALGREAAESPFGYFRGTRWQDLTPSNKYGMMPETEGAVNNLVSQAFNQVSGRNAARGQVAPENLGATAGGAIQNILLTLLPMIQQFQQWRMMLPEQLYGQRIGFASEGARIGTPALGSYGTASSSSFGFGGSVGSSGSGAKNAIY